MEMSGFARHEGSVPIIGDIGVIWPVIALRVAQRLGLALKFLSHPRQSPQGQAMREEIVSGVKAISRKKMLAALRG